jgi:hypothetical protein
MECAGPYVRELDVGHYPPVKLLEYSPETVYRPYFSIACGNHTKD